MKRDGNRKRTKPAKRPSGVNQLPSLRRQSTKDVFTQEEISKVMSILGKRGGAAGGKKRAERMTGEERSEAASKAARARWKKT
jgi:hypothetical protein